MTGLCVSDTLSQGLQEDPELVGHARPRNSGGTQTIAELGPASV